MVVGKATIKGLDFETLEDYYNYIVDSEINGNYSQMKSLYSKFSKDQKKDFLRWLLDNHIKNINIAELL